MVITSYWLLYIKYETLTTIFLGLGVEKTSISQKNQQKFQRNHGKGGEKAGSLAKEKKQVLDFTRTCKMLGVSRGKNGAQTVGGIGLFQFQQQ